MLYPEIKKLMGEFDSRYSLVVATSKRARQLAAAGNCDKAVSMAIKEISEGYVHPILTDEAAQAEQAAVEE